jgi:TfoX/Sxy family transcriptional regulator of competence genes
MATWQKSSTALVALFQASLPDHAGVQPRKMFGYPCAFVNGNMFCGLHEQRLIVRVPEEAASRPFKVMGRVMKEYVALEDALDMPLPQVRQWVARAYDYTRALPPKALKLAAAPAKKTQPKKPSK